MSSKEIERLANEALAETSPDQLAELMKNEVNLKIASIMAEMGTQKEGIGPVEFSIKFGRACYELGKKDLKEFMGE